MFRSSTCCDMHTRFNRSSSSTAAAACSSNATYSGSSLYIYRVYLYLLTSSNGAERGYADA
jgi:hypothetical protein